MIYEITDPKSGKVLEVEGDSPPTEEELNGIFSRVSVTRQPADALSGANIEKTGALSQAFLEPSTAGTRELLRSKKISHKLIGAIPAGLGSNLAGLGFFGEEAQGKVGKGYLRPSESETFQNEAIRKVGSDIAERASKRTGLFAPDKPLGKVLIYTEQHLKGFGPSAVGMVQDMYTNPIDWLFSAGDIGGAINTAKASGKSIVKSGPINKLTGLYRKATGRGVSTIKRGADVASENKKIIVGLEAAFDYAKSNGKAINTAQDALDVVSDTKKSVLSEYNNLRQSAQGTGATVDMRMVGQDVFESQASTAAKLANKNLRTTAFDMAADYAHEGKVSLDTAEETLRRLNAMRPSTLSTMDDVSKAALNETAAKAIRRQLDDVILQATGKEYQPLKSLYGSLIELDKDFSRAVIRAGKQSNNSIVRQLSESIDNVPLIYGILSGNIQLAGAATIQKTGKVLLRQSIDNQIKGIFSIMDTLKNPKFAPKLTTLSTTRKAVRGQ